MYIAKPNRGYSAAAGFIDPESTVSQKWHGNGLRFKNLNGAKLDPVLVARNTGDQVSRVQGKILYTGPSGEMSAVNIPLTTIAPRSTKLINLDNLIENANVPNAVKYGGIELEYNTPKGTIVTSVQSVSQNGNHVFQVPMFDPKNMPSSAGGFPWKADGDYTTVVYIKNETDSPKKYIAHLVYEGGGYSIGIKELKPGQTVAVDFREFRDSQTPDSQGNIIPLNVDKGQIAWSAHGAENKVLSGRSEQISVADGVASTYACYNCCPNVLEDVWVNPEGVNTTVGDTTAFIGTQTETNCYGQILGPYTSESVAWNSFDTAVATIASDGYSEAVGAGETNIQGTWERVIWFNWGGGYCEPLIDQITRQAPMQVTSVASLTASLPSTINPVSSVRPAAGTFNTTNASTTFASGSSPSDVLVTFKSSAANLSVTAMGVVPTSSASSLKWKIDRDPSDSGLTGTPTLSTQTGATLTITPNTSGNFRLICYYDTNGNAAYDAGEEQRILRLVVVQVTLNITDCNFTRPSTASSFNGGTDFVAANDAMRMTCDVIIESGGTGRRVGLDLVHLGNVGNLTSDTFTINFPIPTPTPPPPANQVGIEYEAPNGTAANSSQWFPLPMVDTSRIAPGAEPTGTNTAFRFNSLDTPSLNTSGGQKRLVTSQDLAPNFSWDATHPVTTNIWTNTTGGNRWKDFIVGYSSSFPRAYVALAKGEWEVLPVGTNNGASVWQQSTGAAISIVSAISSLVSGNSPQTGDTAGVQVLGRSFVNEFETKHTP